MAPDFGFNNYPNDRPNLPNFTGRLGYKGREFFARLLADLPKFERALARDHRVGRPRALRGAQTPGAPPYPAAETF